MPALIFGAVIFGTINAFLKPIVSMLSCALTCATLGLFALIINTLMLALTAWIAGLFDLAFEVDGFWAAFLGALVISLTSTILGTWADRAILRPAGRTRSTGGSEFALVVSSGSSTSSNASLIFPMNTVEGVRTSAGQTFSFASERVPRNRELPPPYGKIRLQNDGESVMVAIPEFLRGHPGFQIRIRWQRVVGAGRAFARASGAYGGSPACM